MNNHQDLENVKCKVVRGQITADSLSGSFCTWKRWHDFLNLEPLPIVGNKRLLAMIKSEYKSK